MAQSLVQADKLHFRFHNEGMLLRESGFEEHNESEIAKKALGVFGPSSHEHYETDTRDKSTRHNINPEVDPAQSASTCSSAICMT